MPPLSPACALFFIFFIFVQVEAIQAFRPLLCPPSSHEPGAHITLSVKFTLLRPLNPAEGGPLILSCLTSVHGGQPHHLISETVGSQVSQHANQDTKVAWAVLPWGRAAKGKKGEWYPEVSRLSRVIPPCRPSPRCSMSNQLTGQGAAWGV